MSLYFSRKGLKSFVVREIESRRQKESKVNLKDLDTWTLQYWPLSCFSSSLDYTTQCYLKGLTSLPLLLPWLTVSKPKILDWRLTSARTPVSAIVRLYKILQRPHIPVVIHLTCVWLFHRCVLQSHCLRSWNTRLWQHMQLCVCVYVCMCVCVCLRACVRACVCVFARVYAVVYDYYST